MKIAIMQPYYYPYAGYFRLFVAADLFVILDDVQLNRRGRVHRCQVKEKWIHTLPIKKTSRDDTMIKDMQWQEGKGKAINPIDLIIGTMSEICEKLCITFNTARSSGIKISEKLRGQDRIIAICKALKATEYINLPGGRHLYDDQTFKDNGIKLTFLPEWQGSYDSILERLVHEVPDKIREEIYAQI